MNPTLVEIPEVLVIVAGSGALIASAAVVLEAVRQRRIARQLGAPPRAVAARIALRAGVVRSLSATGFLMGGIALVRLPPRPVPFGRIVVALTFLFLVCTLAILIASIFDIADRRRLVEFISNRDGPVREEEANRPLAS